MRGARPELRVIGADDEDGAMPPAAIEQPAAIVPPATFPPDLVAEWQRIVTDLRDRRLWKDSMSGFVTAYVLAYDTALRLELQIAREGASVQGAGGALKPHPATGLLRSSRETVARLGAELGLTPTARSRKALRPDDGPDLFSQTNDDGWG